MISLAIYMPVNLFFCTGKVGDIFYAVALRLNSGGQHGKCPPRPPPIDARSRTCQEVRNKLCDNFVYRKRVDFT